MSTASIVVTEVRIKQMNVETAGNDRVKAFASIVINRAIAIRDIKVIELADKRTGTMRLIVAMPTRKVTDRCGCGNKNALQARFCSRCGCRLDEKRAFRDTDSHVRCHADTTYPVTASARMAITRVVLEAFLAGVDNYNDDWADDSDPVCRSFAAIEAA